MIRKFVFAMGLCMLPAAASAQHPNHPAAQKMSQQDHNAEMKQHEMFVQSLVDKRAELKLTAAQVTKLKAFQAKMAAHHKAMMQGDSMKHGAMMMKHDSMMMKHDSMMMAGHKGMMHGDSMMMRDSKMMTDMHKELLSIFTPVQRKKVEALMNEHMKGMKGMKCCDGMK